MPAPKALPEDIRALAFRNAVEVSDTRWDFDNWVRVPEGRATSSSAAELVAFCDDRRIT